MRASLVALALICAGCSFPTEGVPVEGNPPDADTSPDACAPVDEVCDGVDNDCDGTPDEGFASNDPCDGPDADLCIDDVMVCGDDGGEVCATGTDNAELCNALDDDCDGTPDEGFALSVACDGVDGDACTEGVTVCNGDGSGTDCTDATDTIVEICDTLNNDCDLGVDEGFDLDTDINNCGECENTCTNANGTTLCDGGCVPTCSNGAVDCNGDLDDGCELVDTGPSCAGTTAGYALDSNGNSADVNGDTAGETITLTGTTERFMRIKMRESSFAGTQDPITGRLTLTSGTGTDWDLYVYCVADCNGTPRSDASDVIEVGRTDATGEDRSFDIIAEVRYDPATPSTACSTWTLTVVGDPSPTPSDRCGGT